LIDALAQRRPTDLREAWREALDRGPTWKDLVVTGLGLIAAKARDRALHVCGAPRNIIHGLDLRFVDAVPRYNVDHDTVLFEAESARERVLCAISREALEDHFGADGLTKEQRVEVFRRHRGEIQEMARLIYLDHPVPADGSVLITSADVPMLRHSVKRGKAIRKGAGART
jgi:hypothetical protein